MGEDALCWQLVGAFTLEVRTRSCLARHRRCTASNSHSHHQGAPLYTLHYLQRGPFGREMSLRQYEPVTVVEFRAMAWVLNPLSPGRDCLGEKTSPSELLQPLTQRNPNFCGLKRRYISEFFQEDIGLPQDKL